MELTQYINYIRGNRDLSQGQMVEAMRIIMSGQCADEDIKSFLVALSDKGESVEEIVGAASVLREKALRVQAPEDAIDCCGTGGDGVGSYNISTAVALICASCGVPVAKHGNRAASSKSGAADVLEALGVNLDIASDDAEKALQEIGFAFLMAQKHHQAMRHVAAIRKDIGRKTIFNLIGPLANPAGTSVQLIGVYDRAYIRRIAEALVALGSKRAWVVHGSDGLDEITVTGSTTVAEITEDGEIQEFKIEPSDFDLALHDLQEIKGGDAQVNKAALEALLNGGKGAYRDIVLANCAAVLKLHNSVETIKDGVILAARAIDDGRALKLLQRYIEFTQTLKVSS